MNTEQGWPLMVLGLSIGLGALGIVIGMLALHRRSAASGHVARSPFFDRPRAGVSQLTRESSEEEVAAAIAMALAHLVSYDLCRSNLGEALEHGPSEWWTVGQVQRLALDALELRLGA